MDEKEIQYRFYEDVSRISQSLVNAFSLKHERKFLHLSDPIHRWMDFRLRFIEPISREICLSNKLKVKDMSRCEREFLHIINLIKSGGDVNPYQGKGIILFDDVS